MKKRKWCYVLPPYVYDITCDKCNGTNIEWSEYESKIWCYDCKIDTKGTGGVFVGPIPIYTSYLLGISFDRINLETKQIERLNLDTLEKENKMVWDPPEVWTKLAPTEKDITIGKLKEKKISNTYGDYLREEGSKYFELVPASKHNSTKCQLKKNEKKIKSKSKSM